MNREPIRQKVSSMEEYCKKESDKLLHKILSSKPANRYTPFDSPHTRLKCLEIASTLKTFDGDKMTTKELLDKAEELFNFINQK